MIEVLRAIAENPEGQKLCSFQSGAEMRVPDL